MSGFEIFGSIFGFVSIVLTVRASVWCWPTGIVSIGLLLVTYARARLYGDVVNYVVMLVLSVWGWTIWGRRVDAVPVRFASRRTRIASVMAVALGTPAMGFVFARYTDAALPYWDSLVNALALVAQVLLARKLVENWILWIISDVIAIGVYLAKGLYVVAGLYVVFLIVASLGLRQGLAKGLGG
jgi:nicotinamide mononucleotide transporter